MRILLVGAGGVGSAFCAIAARRDFFEQIVVSDYDESRAKHAADAVDSRFSAARVDATSADAVAELVRRHDITHVMNAVDPRLVIPIFNSALTGGADYLDMAMSSSPSRISGSPQAGWRWSGSAWSQGFPTCSLVTPLIICSRTSTSWA